MHRTRNLLLVLAGVVILIVIGVLAGRRGKAAIAVVTQPVRYASFQVKLPENGMVQHPRAATVPTLVAGNIGQIYVHSGSRVQAGQLLATIENPTLQTTAASSQADYDSAVANISTARVNEQNAKVGYQAQVATNLSNLREAQRVYDADVSLYKNRAIPRNQLDTDRAKLDQAQVAYDQAVRQLKLGAVTGYGQNSVQFAQAAAEQKKIINQQNQQQLSFTRITAPFSGVIQTVATQTGDPLTNLHAGDPVTAGQALFSIAEGDNYIVKAQVDEQDIINVRVGQQANITGEDFPGKTIVGHVVNISPVAIKSTDTTSTTRQVLTTIHLDHSPDYLKDGMTVDVDILTTNLPHVIAVPTSALVPEKGKNYVFVVRKGKAHKVPVKLGQANDTQTVITSGLAAGDRLVAGRNPLLTDGAVVTATAASPNPAAT